MSAPRINGGNNFVNVNQRFQTGFSPAPQQAPVTTQSPFFGGFGTDAFMGGQLWQPPAANLTTDSRGYPKGTVPVMNGKVEIPGLGVFDAPANGKTQKIKLDKKNELRLTMNEDGTVNVEVKKKKKKGFFSKIGSALKKVGGFIKKALPIVTTVASFIPGLNAIAIPLKIATAVSSGIDAIKNKNWLGAISSFAGGIAGGAAAFGAKGLASTMSMVSKGANAAGNFWGAVQSKSPSGILGAAAGMFQFGSEAVAGKSAEWATRLNNWAGTAAKWGQYASYVENPQAAIQGYIQSQVQNQINRR